MSVKNFIPEDGSLWSIRLAEVRGNNGQKIVLHSDGRMIISSENVDLVTISSSGELTFHGGVHGSVHGGMTYNNVSNTLTATTFRGDLSGTSTNTINIGVNPSSIDADASLYPIFVSTTTGNLPPLVDTQLSYNPSSNTLTVPNINVSSTIQSGEISLVKIVSGTVTHTFSSTQKVEIITMPTGCTCFNLVSFQPVSGGNNILYIYNWALGVSSGGVQNQNQLRVTAQLGNNVSVEPFTIRFYWTV
jgi:hypothetical protein